MNMLLNKNFGFMGAGRMTQVLIKGFLDSKLLKPSQIYVTNRSPNKLDKLVQQFGVNPMKNNEDLLEKTQIVFLCMKPMDLPEAIQSISFQFLSHHIVVSIAAGITIEMIQKSLNQVDKIVRVMPNTPSKMAQGVIGYCMSDAAKDLENSFQALLQPLGLAVAVEEGDPFDSFMVACSSGTGFVYELMIYWQDWLEEYGFDAPTAKAMTIKTFLGAAQMAEQNSQTDLDHLQDEVVTKKGVTAAGLDSMRENEIERILRISFEKAMMRNQEISKSLG